MKKNKLPEMLTQILRKRKMSLRDLSRKSKIPQSTLQGWMKGVNPSVESLLAVSAVLQISLDDLVTGATAKNDSENLVLEGLFKLRLERVSEDKKS